MDKSKTPFTPFLGTEEWAEWFMTGLCLLYIAYKGKING